MSLLRVTALMAAPIASWEPLHLDGLLVACHPDTPTPTPTRSTPVAELGYPPLPLVTLRAHGARLYASSAWQFPPGMRPGREMFTKRRDAEDVESYAIPFTPSSGPGKNYQIPIPTYETPTVSWLVLGARRGILKLLRRARSVGAYRRQGYGQVRDWHAEEIDGDPLRVLVEGGAAARFLPRAWTRTAATTDVGACLPPYWHPGLGVERVRPGWACELTDEARRSVEGVR